MAETPQTQAGRIAALHRQAARDYRDGAAQRDPATVRAAEVTARKHADEADQAWGGRA